MKKMLQTIVVSSFITLSLFSCGKKSEEKKTDVKAATETTTTETKEVKEDAKEEVKQKVNAVCLWNKLSLKQEPKRKGKWITGLSFGESVEFLGETAIDSTDKNKKYLKVKLSDGKEGWANAYCLIENAETATIIADAQLYKRPDLVTMQNGVKLSKMSIIAVANTQEEWIEVFGKEKKKKGWIKSSSISTDKIDFAVALLYSKISKKDDKKRVEALTNLSQNVDFASSKFISVIKEEIAALEVKITEVKEVIPAEESSPATETVSDTATN